jgi:hypothetical protein
MPRRSSTPASKLNNEWISGPPLPARRRRFAPFENIRLQFEHHKTEISRPDHIGV